MAELEVLYTSVFARNLAAEEKTVVNRGGARSSKSYSIAQLLICKGTEGEHNILVTRKTMPSLKMTAYPLITGLIKAYGYYDDACHYQSSPCHYQLGKTTFWFVSVDEIDKLKSTEFDIIWMEEANEYTWQEYIVLKLRLSGKPAPGERNHIYLSFNPVDQNHWIPTKLIPQPDVLEIVSTYRDNPFLDQDYVNMLLGLREEDPNYFKIYAEGEYGSVEGLVYSNWDTRAIEGAPDDVYYGLDFGFNNPTALIEIAEKDKELYLSEKVYQNKLTTEDLLVMMAAGGVAKKAKMTADSEDPKAIEEIFRADYNIHPAEKGPGSVRRGIDLCKRKRIHINPSSVNLIKEFKAYKWKTDKNGNPLDEPVKFLDHGMDATRYGVQGVGDAGTRFSFGRLKMTPAQAEIKAPGGIVIIPANDPNFKQKVVEATRQDGESVADALKRL